jgi:ATPase subunit of ABC transporter with duplicated ATPase domains
VPASLIARSLTVVRGPLVVLDDVELTLTPGHRIGLVGPNGVGKSTLLGALAGHVELDRGSVEVAPRTATVGLLPQEPERSATETVSGFLARRSGVAGAQAELDAATGALAAAEPGADDRYSDALDRWLALGAADFEARLGEVWHDLALDERLLDQPTITLSGGEAARSSLASLLLSRYDVFLLDEPTNDLDLDGLDRLERWIVGLEAPVMLVSHDRSFLRRTITTPTGPRGSPAAGSRSSRSASWLGNTPVNASRSTTRNGRHCSNAHNASVSGPHRARPR